ncbi:MAG: hypothetical protein QME47_03640 [Candidatus Thermoplasmatota archaeon]|nr:hypothetical protein [Candidatus Thermoplasmatota archaeon]
MQQEIEKRLIAIVDEKLSEVKSEIIELAKERVIEAVVADLAGRKPAEKPFCFDKNRRSGARSGVSCQV